LLGQEIIKQIANLPSEHLPTRLPSSY